MTEIDRTLATNIVKSQDRMVMVLEKRTFSEIAVVEGTLKCRVQDVFDLAIPTPYILDFTAQGEQPECLNSDYLVKSGVPAAWTEQRALFAWRSA